MNFFLFSCVGLLKDYITALYKTFAPLVYNILFRVAELLSLYSGRIPDPELYINIKQPELQLIERMRNIFKYDPQNPIISFF